MVETVSSIEEDRADLIAIIRTMNEMEITELARHKQNMSNESENQ